MAMTLTSTAFGDGEAIPEAHTCDGEDLSPPLTWRGAPEGCRSFVLLCDDPDAPAGTWHHWAVFDIPAERTGLAEGVAAKAQSGPVRQAVNDFRRLGYGGPCPPRGHGAHRYRFQLLALSVERLDVPDGASCKAVAAAARRHKLGEAVLTGTYER